MDELVDDGDEDIEAAKQWVGSAKQRGVEREGWSVVHESCHARKKKQIFGRFIGCEHAKLSTLPLNSTTVITIQTVFGSHHWLRSMSTCPLRINTISPLLRFVLPLLTWASAGV